jgi:hypothetical protein
VAWRSPRQVKSGFLLAEWEHFVKEADARNNKMKQQRCYPSRGCFS